MTHIFHENDLVDMANVKANLDPLLSSFPCDVPPITGQDLKKQMAKTKSSRAVALDGWRIDELKFLPIEWFDLLANCLNLIENGSPWPEICCMGVITAIPKGAGTSPEDAKSGQLIAEDGLSTRPITNLSPLYTTYSSCRYSQMTECNGESSGSRPAWPVLVKAMKFTISHGR